MTEKYFSFAFAVDGDLAAVPNAPPIGGTVNYDTGFPIGYELPNTDPGYLSIPRTQFNQIMNDVTGAIQQVQQTGFPSWISAAANNGTPFAYSAGAQVWGPDGIAYVSLINSNTDMPPTANWLPISYGFQAFSTGDIVEQVSTTLPSTWLWVDGRTIGSASSGGTSRANSDTQPLFTVLWNSCTNTVLPIQDSSGSLSSRGISAAADFAANKRMPLPDKRGRVAACADQFPGGSAAGRLNNAAQGGVDGTILANAGGEANHALNSSENGSHSHDGSGMSTNSAGTHTHSFVDPTTGQTIYWVISGSPGSQQSFNQTALSSHGPDALTTQSAGAHTHSISGSTGSSGTGTAHNTVQPTFISYFRIKL